MPTLLLSSGYSVDLPLLINVSPPLTEENCRLTSADPRDTASDECTSTVYETITYYNTGHAPTETSSTSGPVLTSFSSIAGPYIAAYSSTWSQAIIPITVGTVMFIVNEATNKTTSTTIYHTDFVQNGSTTLLSRTDTNSDGTVTYVATYGLNLSTTMYVLSTPSSISLIE